MVERALTFGSVAGVYGQGDPRLRGPDGASPHGALRWPGRELAADPRFTDVRQELVPRRLTMTAEHAHLARSVSQERHVAQSTHD